MDNEPRSHRNPTSEEVLDESVGRINDIDREMMRLTEERRKMVDNLHNAHDELSMKLSKAKSVAEVDPLYRDEVENRKRGEADDGA